MEGTTPAAPLDLAAGAIQSIRVGTVFASALACLPSFALDALFVGSTVPGPKLQIGLAPCIDAPGFVHSSPVTQVGQSVNQGVPAA
jgi:hypothetical protein